MTDSLLWWHYLASVGWKYVFFPLQWDFIFCLSSWRYHNLKCAPCSLLLFYYLMGNGVNTPCDAEQTMPPDSGLSVNCEWSGRRNRVMWAPPFFMDFCPPAAEEASGSPSACPRQPHTLPAFSLCSPHRYRCSCWLSGSCYNVRASNLLSIKAMQREILLACQRNKRTSGESFEQVDR